MTSIRGMALMGAISAALALAPLAAPVAAAAPVSAHRVVYRVTTALPEQTKLYYRDSSPETETRPVDFKATGPDGVWEHAVTFEGPGVASIRVVMSAEAPEDSGSCEIEVDGEVVDSQTGPSTSAGSGAPPPMPTMPVPGVGSLPVPVEAIPMLLPGVSNTRNSSPTSSLMCKAMLDFPS